MEELHIGKSRLYELRSSFLAAKAAGRAGEWLPAVRHDAGMRPRTGDKVPDTISALCCGGVWLK